jgi:hypothetical protein
MTESAGQHDHQTATKYWYNNKTYDHQGDRAVVDSRNVDVHLERTSKEGAHTHGIAMDLDKQLTGLSSGPNRPRWYALCFIMKL